MRKLLGLGLGMVAAITIGGSASQGLHAQTNSPPTYQADPNVFKMVFEDQNFRVILGTWAPGVTDKPHSHPVPSVAYALTDCALQLTSADGKTITLHPKAGMVTTVPITASHTGHNIGSTECRTLFVERK